MAMETSPVGVAGEASQPFPSGSCCIPLQPPLAYVNKPKTPCHDSNICANRTSTRPEGEGGGGGQ